MKIYEGGTRNGALRPGDPNRARCPHGHRQLLDNGIQESGVQEIFLDDDNRLTLVTWLGSVFRGEARDQWRGEGFADLTWIFQGSKSFGQSVEWLDFLNGDEEWIHETWIDSTGGLVVGLDHGQL